MMPTQLLGRAFIEEDDVEMISGCCEWWLQTPLSPKARRSHTTPRLGSGVNSAPETVLALHCQSFLLRQGVKNKDINCFICFGIGCNKQQSDSEIKCAGAVHNMVCKERPVWKQKNRQCSHVPWKNWGFLLLLEGFILLLTVRVLIATC